jgi:hypothetical protein
VNQVDVTRLPETGNDFEQVPLPSNGKAVKVGKTPDAASTLFKGVGRKTAEAAKKGETSTSRTGKGKQVSYEFAKPPKNLYVKVSPSPDYSVYNIPVFRDENNDTFHYIDVDLFETGELPERFKNACKIMNIFTTGVADGTFILWYVFVSASKWYKAAMKTVELAKHHYGIVSSIKARQTYSFETATEPIPEPKWHSLPPFEQLLVGAFDSVVSVAGDKVVTNFMSGGIAARDEEEE